MKKLKLNLDEIKVESFIVNNKDQNGGTVVGAEAQTQVCDTEVECQAYETQLSCYGPTCIGSCTNCGLTVCVATCYDECRSLAYYCPSSPLWTCNIGTDNPPGYCMICGA